MKTFSFISDSLVSALGWTLLHAVWQGFVVALLVVIALFLLRRSSSLARYWTSISALGLQLATSVFTFWFYYQPVLAATTSLPKATFIPTAIAQNGAYKMAVLPWYKQVLWFLQAHLDTVVLLWGVGASVLLLRLLVNWVLVQQLKSEGIQLTEPRLQVVFKRLMSSLQIKKTVLLFESARVSSPLVIGFFKPVVLLPIGLATGLSTAQIEAVLAHELAHIKRHDYLINLLQSLVEVVYFFHPALWWVSARVRQERENCCDDCAVSVCGSKLALAQALTFVEEYRQTPTLAMALHNGKMPLLCRIQRILGVSEKAKTHNSYFGGVLLFLFLAVGLSVYATQKTDKPKQPKARNVSHTSGGTKIVLDENGKLTKITWKNRALSVAEVADIQQLRQQIEAGKIKVENVKNAEQKAILNRLFEVETGLSSGMNALANGLESMITLVDSIKIDGHFELNETVHIDNYTEVNTALASLSDTLNDGKMNYHNAQIDSLGRLMNEINKNSEALQLDMEQHRFKVEEQERKQETLNWKKQRLQEGRDKILEKRNRLMYNDDNKKVKKSEAETEKELADYEQQIKAQEQQISDLNKQIAELRTQIQSTEQPLRQLERQLEKVNQQNEKLSEQMSRHSEAMSGLIKIPTEMEINALVEDAMKEVPSEAELRRITSDAMRSVREVRMPRPPRAPRPAVAPRAVVAPRAAVAPRAVPRPLPAPAAPPKPKK